MRQLTVGVLISSALVIVGCATVSQMTATGGSRADGVVRLSFEAGMFDKVAIDEISALATARRRCETWGYSDAEPFGGITRQCQAMSGYGCMRWFVTKEYQCTSGSGVTSPSVSVPVPAAVSTTAPAIMPSVNSSDAPGTIDLGGGVRLVPAKTVSGYCIKGPSNYIGTGAVNRPVVTKAKPLCT
jgi:hypothetical protein